MRHSSIFWLLGLLAITASACVVATKRDPVVREHRTVHEEPPPPRDERPPPPTYRPERRPSWDSRGWTLIGEQSVQGGRDKDIIRVSRREGPFTRLMLVVEGGDLRMGKLILTYEDGTKHAPDVDHQFSEGSRTRPIDIRGRAQFIKEIELRYGNLPGGGRATVQIWGREGDPGDVGQAPRPEPRPSPGGWDSRGWTLLGEQWVQGKRDRDVIQVGAGEGRFSRLMLVVEEGDVRMNDIVIEYDNGRKQSQKFQHHFGEGARTRPIDVRGEARIIRRVELRYGNLPGGGRAKVQLWGREG